MMTNDELGQKIDNVLLHAPKNRHSYFQLRYFVIGKEVTPQAQMWQCLRELQSRKNTMDALALSIEETKDQLDLLDIEYAKLLFDHDKLFDTFHYTPEIQEREHVIKCRQIERKKQSLQNSLLELKNNLMFAKEESDFLLRLYEDISKVVPVKDYDDFEAQKEYWNERIKQQIDLKLLLGQRLDNELVQTALALHNDAPIRVQIKNLLEHIQEQVCKKENDEQKDNKLR